MKLTQIEMDSVSNSKQTINSVRKAELRKDENYIHIMKYMGSKRELLPDIKTEVSKMVPKGSTVLDLFAGTASVGAYLKKDFNIVSNDIQEYSKVLANALVCSTGKRLKIRFEDVQEQFMAAFIENKSALTKMLKKTLQSSNDFVTRSQGQWDEKSRKEYLAFFETFPCPENEFKTENKELKKLKTEYFSRNKDHKIFPYLQTTFLFSETYFSLEQAIDIDSIRYAIDKVFVDEISASISLSALMYAHSYCSSGTGHFAMFRDITSVKSAQDVFKYRPKIAMDYFQKKLLEIVEYSNDYNGNNHEAWNLDFKEALSDKNLKDVDLLYADPPYSFVHYSRFYHATESLVKYDYNIPEHKGRYRTDRHQSPFCQKLNVAEAFKVMIDSCYKNQVSILFSYADTGMIEFATLKKQIQEAGYKFEFREINYDHSTMGRSGHKSNAIKEYLLKAIYKPHH
jgi:adenine-specific DNA-methyltransferase